MELWSIFIATFTAVLNDDLPLSLYRGCVTNKKKGKRDFGNMTFFVVAIQAVSLFVNNNGPIGCVFFLSCIYKFREK